MVLRVEEALLVSALITGLASLLLSLIRSDEFEENFFTLPVLRPLANIRNSLNQNTNDKCPNCPTEHVQPYLQISMKRIQISANLGSIAFGLAAQAITLIVYQNYSAGISYFIWATIPTLLVVRYVLELKDVFHYWSRPAFRPAFPLAAIAIGIIGQQNPYYLNLIGWLIEPQIFAEFGTFQLHSWLLFGICSAIFISFLLIRNYLNRRLPSLRTRILRVVKGNSKGFTTNEFYTLLNPTKDEALTENNIKSTLIELVYQGKMNVHLDNRLDQPRYFNNL